MEKDVYIRMADQESCHWWFAGRRDILKSIIQKYTAQNKGLQILDAGCGTGGNYSLLKDFGEVKAFEIDAQALAIARERGLVAEEGSLPDAIPFENQCFDAIILFDVLEHVKEDKASLVELRRRLNPGGRLFITVPANPALWSSHDVQHHHFRRYRKPQLEKLLTDSGLRIIRLSYYNFFLFPVISLLRLSHILLSKRGSDDERMPGKLVNRLLFKIFSSEKWLLARFNLPFGISILAVTESTESPE